MGPLINVTVVRPPALTVTVAVPAPKLLLTSNPALGEVLTPVSEVPAGRVSVIVAVPAATRMAELQEPVATVTVVDCGGVAAGTLKLYVPGVELAATQTSIEPLLHAATEITLLSSVTAPLSAMARPGSMVALVLTVTLVLAKIFPKNCVPVPRVAELPIWKYTLQGIPLLIMTIDELLAVVRVLPIWKIKTELGLP